MTQSLNTPLVTPCGKDCSSKTMFGATVVRAGCHVQRNRCTHTHTYCSIGSSNSEKYRAPKQPVLGPQSRSKSSQGISHLSLFADMCLHQESKLAGKLHLRPRPDSAVQVISVKTSEGVGRSPHVGTAPAVGARALYATPGDIGSAPPFSQAQGGHSTESIPRSCMRTVL